MPPPIRKKSKDYKIQAKLYPDCTEYDCEAVIEGLKDIFTEWLYIVHDRDQKRYPKRLYRDFKTNWRNYAFRFWTHGRMLSRTGRKCIKPHIHFYGKNNHNVQYSLASVIAHLQIPFRYAQNGDFQYISNWSASMAYAIHLNAPDKFQYSPNDVYTNIDNYVSRYVTNSANDLNRQLYIVMEWIEDSWSRSNHGLTYFELIKKCHSCDFNIQLKKPLLIKDLLYSYRNPDKI